jgi:hypothetical protein
MSVKYPVLIYVGPGVILRFSLLLSISLSLSEAEFSKPYAEISHFRLLKHAALLMTSISSAYDTSCSVVR